MEPPTIVDEEGNSVVLSLERKSIAPFRTQDEYLYAMKEDLAEWFNALYKEDMTADNFYGRLETGVLLCKHANKVQDHILKRLSEGPVDSSMHSPQLAKDGVKYRSNVNPESFQARDNVSNFIAWARGLGINDVLLFETEDLVLRKNERNFVLCLLEVARHGARYGMLAPVLIQLEQEIDAEIAGKKPPPKPVVQRKTVDLMSLDELVRELVGRCTCPDQFPIIRVSEGKYKIGEAQTLIFVRVLRNHVMVRIGGGWDTLENYLNRHDPCRCSTGHKSPRKIAAGRSHTTITKRPSVSQANNLTPLQIKTKTVTKETVTKEKVPKDKATPKTGLRYKTKTKK